MKKHFVGLLTALITFSVGFSLGNQAVSEVAEKEPVAIETVVQLPSVNEPTVPSLQEDSVPLKEEGVYAWYYPLDDALQLRGEVAFIALSGETSDENGKVVFNARVMTNFFDDVDRDYAHAVKTKVVGDRLTFRTEAVKSVSFSFDGKFFKGRKMGEQHEPILRGTLTRLVKGKPAGAFTGDFGYAEPYCLH